MGECAFQSPLQSGCPFSQQNYFLPHLCELNTPYEEPFEKWEDRGELLEGSTLDTNEYPWNDQPSGLWASKVSSGTISGLDNDPYLQKMSPVRFWKAESGDLEGIEQFDTSQALNSFLPAESSREYTCRECERRYSNSYKLEQHAKMENHKAYQCNFFDCGRGYSRRDSYVRHIASHKGFGHHVCGICARSGQIKTFKRRDNLIQHERACHAKEPSRLASGSVRAAGMNRSSSNTIHQAASHVKTLGTVNRLSARHLLAVKIKDEDVPDLRTDDSLSNDGTFGQRRRTQAAQLEGIRMTDITKELENKDGHADNGVIQCIKKHFPSDDNSITLEELATGIGRLAKCAMQKHVTTR